MQTAIIHLRTNIETLVIKVKLAKMHTSLVVRCGSCRDLSVIE